jgi:hypothetical protein
MGAEYAICGDFCDQTIHIRNIDELSQHEILAFSFCYAIANDFRGLRIVNEHTYGKIQFQERRGALPIYAIEIRDSIVQVSTSEVSVNRVIAHFWKANPTNSLELIPKGKYVTKYDCE